MLYIYTNESMESIPYMPPAGASIQPFSALSCGHRISSSTSFRQVMMNERVA